jgi:hypothetical protein
MGRVVYGASCPRGVHWASYPWGELFTGKMSLGLAVHGAIYESESLLDSTTPYMQCTFTNGLFGLSSSIRLFLVQY